MLHEPDLATVAALIGEPSRALILSALLGGEALPASELAYRAQITPQTASSHLSRLVDGKLLTVTSAGRHRYYKLKSREVAQLLETLATVSPLPEPRTPRVGKISPELCNARTCYDHLAGKLGVAVTRAMLERGYIVADQKNFTLTPAGMAWCESHNIDVDALKKLRRKFAYACLDWSERHDHLAGTLGASIADLFFARGWIKRLPHTRALQITPSGKRVLLADFGIIFA